MSSLTSPLLHPAPPSPSPLLDRRQVLATAAAGALLGPSAAWAQAPVLRLCPNTFAQTLAEGTAAGAVVELAPGRYGAVELRGPDLPAVLRSADSANPATFSGFQLFDAQPMTIEDIFFDHIHTLGESMEVRPFRFRDSQGLRLNRCHFDGAGIEATTMEGGRRELGWGVGPSFNDCIDLTVTRCRISRFLRGLSMRGCNDVRIANSELIDMRMDGMSFSMMQRLVIENNYIHDFHRSDQGSEHSDMIQFWTESTTRPSRAITIRGNVLSRGAGSPTQSIFMRNELVDTNRAGDEMLYRDILVEDNVILNSHLHGIHVGHSHGVAVRYNTLAQVPYVDGDARQEVHIPIIGLRSASRQVEVVGNMAWRIDGFRDQPDWRMRDNLLIQRQSLMQPNHYSQVFAGLPDGDPQGLESYIYRADGPAGSGQVGAPRLRP